MRILAISIALLCSGLALAQQVRTPIQQRIINQSQVPSTLGATQSAVGSGNAQLSSSAAKAGGADSNQIKSGSTSAFQKSGILNDSSIRIGIILPFDAKNSAERLYAYLNDEEKSRIEPEHIKETVRDALDFYEGLRYALSSDSSGRNLNLYLYDSQNSDSVVEQLLTDDSLKLCDLIIGPTNNQQAKAVAAFCRKNGIFNIQPFVASKSFSTENPMLVRFMPTIDAHLQKLYEMVMDSFSEENIIIYTTKKERDLAAARYLDTLFSSYNAINLHKIKYSFVNGTDSTQPLAKRTLSNYFDAHRRNIILMTCYDESAVNQQLRTVKENMVVFGMPTWMDGDQIRIDYLNKAEPYITDNFYVDTNQAAVRNFISEYTSANNHSPSRYCYLGYDAMRYLCQVFRRYGKNMKQGFDNESYDGMGFGIHLSPVIRLSRETGKPVINYYNNTAMHIFQVSDYKVWMVR